ncbi:unnamed protein product [Allacma fusca]|uniref:Uncharacterized protein n=2 Tax=Allacma fusca TaxID=39272 RepID=A0A8J2P811_9HEXA|nr:unnamed protein product [Allacma fusca]
MKAVCILLVVVAFVAYVAADEIDPVVVEAKAQSAETPQMPTIDGKLQPSNKANKRGLYGWGWGPGFGGYGWGGYPGFYGGWGSPYGFGYGGYGYGYGWGGFYY